MFFKFLKTPFLYDAATDSAGGGALSDELPAHLADKYVAKATHSGALGQKEQQIKKWQTEAEKLAGEKSVLEAQYRDSNTLVEQLKAQAGQIPDLTKKLSEIEASLASQTGLNARRNIALKYPNLLDEATLALVDNSTLAPEALETHLSKLAERMTAAGATHADQAAGATQKPPPPTTVSSKDLIAEAETLRRKGDMAGFNAKLTEALQLEDAANPFRPPEHKDGP